MQLVRSVLAAFGSSLFGPPFQVLAAAGAVDHEQLVKLASAAFGGIPDEDDTTSVRALTTKVSHSAISH